MNWKNTILISLLLFVNYIMTACNCIYPIDEFCHAADSSDNIGLFVVIEKPDESHIVLELIENINKEIPTDTIKVIGVYGSQCGMGLGIFEEGDTLVVNSNYFEEGYSHMNTGEIFNYLLTDCSRHHLNYSNGNVFGPVNLVIDTMDYMNFKENLGSCFDFLLDVNEPEIIEFEIGPNPTHDYVNIKLENGVNGLITLHNTNGELLKSQRIVALDQEINMANLETGIYLVCIRIGNSIKTEKIVKL